MSQPKDFDGFITPDGELVSIEDVDRMLSILSRGTENRDKIVQALRGLAGICSEAGHYSAAYGYCEKILDLVDAPGAKAKCLLAMGQSLEQSGDHKAALEVYSRAVELPQEPDLVWYFLHNNLGYCLNLEGRYQEAEMHCQRNWSEAEHGESRQQIPALLLLPYMLLYQQNFQLDYPLLLYILRFRVTNNSATPEQN